MAENMQMPKSFFTDVYCLLAYLIDYDLDDKTKALCERLESQLDAKLEAISRREAFTAYKTRPAGTEQRESTRQEYIHKAYIHKAYIPAGFVSKKEKHF